MPKWGLTELQTGAKPWGIDAKWLKPKKIVTDPVHGDVYLNELETQLLDSKSMQRLRRVRQLGTTHLVYPGADHSRFSHALGTLRAAQDLLDAVVANRNGPRPEKDFLSEWQTTPREGISEFDHNLAEVTVATRIGALLHDICHVPYGHTIEDDLRILWPHDANARRFEALWEELPGPVKKLMESAPELKQEILPLIISKDPATGKNLDPANMRYPFVADIVGNTICADLIDYLVRDHRNTGLPIALGYRFANEFYVSPSDHVYWPKRMVIRIARGGQRRTDVVTELLKYLRFRYELSERVLNHHAKLSADAMIGKLLEMWSDWLLVDETMRSDLEMAKECQLDPIQIKARLDDRPLDDKQSETFAYLLKHREDSEDDKPLTMRDLTAETVRQKMEEQFLWRGDDGVLEYLRDWGHEADDDDSRRRTVGELADAVLNRRLYKLVGIASEPADRANAGTIFKKFGDIDQRRKLEEHALAYAEITHGWKAVIWLPKPSMRLKVAEVLIDDGGQITPLDKIDYPGVSEIYKSHENLWAVNVYMERVAAKDSDDPKVEPAAVVRAYLSEAMGIRLREPNPEVSAGTQTKPTVALALSIVLDGQPLDASQGDTVRQRVSELHERVSHIHEGEQPTFKSLLTSVRTTLRQTRNASSRKAPKR